MARCSTNIGNVLPLNLILFRQYTFSVESLKNLNWKILRTVIVCENALSPEQITTFQGAKSCSRIIYDDGYLIIKDIATSNTLKIYNLNGLERKPFLKSSSVAVQEEWKDRSFGIGPVYAANKVLHKNGFKTGLYYITARKLHFLNYHNGAVDEVSLPDKYRFSGLAIDDETHTLAVSSIKNPKANSLMVFALYTYYPQLIFNQLLLIQKSIFGATIVGAEIDQGLLLTLHKANKIMIYSLADVCFQKDCAPPVLFEVATFNHVVAIGSNPYHLVKATRINSFLVQNLENGKISTSVEGKEHSFDSYLGFHPDESPRLIFTDCGTMQIFNIVTENGTCSLYGGMSHSLSGDSGVGDLNNSSFTTTTASGRIVRKPVKSSGYSATSDDDETIHLAWDYEDDLDLLGVLYARQVEGRHPHLKLTLDLIDSPSGKRLRRMELDPKIHVSSFESTEVFLRLDADQCLISIARSSRVSILVFRFVSSSDDQHVIC